MSFVSSAGESKLVLADWSELSPIGSISIYSSPISVMVHEFFIKIDFSSVIMVMTPFMVKYISSVRFRI
jgi:hypothetical protein